MSAQLFHLEEGKLTPLPAALEQVTAGLTSPIRIVSICGPAGDGKSTLCNVLYSCFAEQPYEHHFAASDSLLSGTTAGVWGVGLKLRAPLCGSVLLLDFEGSDMGDEEGEVRLAFLAAAAASVVFFNAKGPRLRQSTKDGLILANLARRVLRGSLLAASKVFCALSPGSDNDDSDVAVHLVMRDLALESMDAEISALERVKLEPSASLSLSTSAAMAATAPVPPAPRDGTSDVMPVVTPRTPLCSVHKGCLHALSAPDVTTSHANFGQNLQFVAQVRSVLVPLVLSPSAAVVSCADGVEVCSALVAVAAAVNSFALRTQRQHDRTGSATAGFDWRLFTKSPEELAAEMERLRLDLGRAEDEALKCMKPAEHQLQSAMINDIAALPDYGSDDDSSDCD